MQSKATPDSSPKARRQGGVIPVRGLVLGLAAGLLAGCGTFHPPKFPPPIREPKPATAVDDVLREENRERSRPLVEQQPRVALSEKATGQPAASTPQAPIRKPVSVVLDGVPLETFINVVYGMELGFAVQVDSSLRSRPDLVSLRITSPQSPEKTYEIAREVLSAYGVQVNELGGVLRFTPAGGGAGELPKVLATRSLPDVPAGQRTVFVAMPLEASQPGAVAAQMRNVFGNSGITLSELPQANAIMISGPGDAVRATMQAVSVLDRAALANRRSIRINPLYLPPELMASELRDMLTAQGVSVRATQAQGGSEGAVALVPVASANALIVFAESEDILNLVTEWAHRLDQPAEDGAGGGVFMYSARHTTVETLLPVLGALIGGEVSGGQQGGATAAAATNAPAASAGGGMGNAGTGTDRQGRASASRAASMVSTISGTHGQAAIDPIRNVIVFQGEAERWRAIQGVLARLDQPARQVVIEVTVAEVTLTDEFANGVEWAFQNVGINGVEGPLGLLTGLAGSSGTVAWQGISSSGQVKALLNLFARDSRVSILSTPRILVKSGETASIDVGTEVPIITSQATAADLPSSGGNSSILQSVQYRKTGMLLDIQAVVHSGQRVDIKLTQEVSEAAKTDTSDISSPSIFSRKLQTSLSLQDGESTLLGGLISRTHSAGKTKVPLLGDIPVLGVAFQSRKAEGVRTELLMLITPYVLEDAVQAKAITDTLRARFAPQPAWNGGLLLQDGLKPELDAQPLRPRQDPLPAPAGQPPASAPQEVPEARGQPLP
ncbi:MAG: hypothetical protein J0L89_03830 [Xanthomonadales bacterium]|nr:hypothetical protein [Xanthomonadaceae bacterium]MBN8223930.1 hypothetical protein [Xanthomonadales bacterium]